MLLGLVSLLLAVGVVVPLGELVAPVLQRLPVINISILINEVIM